MDPRLGGERIAAIGQRCVTQFLELVQRGKFSLKSLLQISFGIGRDLALREIETERRQGCDNDHHRGEQPSAKARYLFVSRLVRGAHGKSTRSVCPFFKSTGFSRVVLLSIHALTV